LYFIYIYLIQVNIKSIRVKSREVLKRSRPDERRGATGPVALGPGLQRRPGPGQSNHGGRSYISPNFSLDIIIDPRAARAFGYSPRPRKRVPYYTKRNCDEQNVDI